MKAIPRWISGTGPILAIAMISGCASMQPLSNYARSGDTVMISLGGSDSNALTPVLKKEALNVTITDADGSTWPVKVRNLVKVHSDATSAYAFRSPSFNAYLESYTDPYQGLWLAVLDLVDPLSGQPLPLAVGNAVFTVSSPQVQNWFDPSGFNYAWTNGNLDQVPIEIIAGTGKPNPLNYMRPMTFSPLDSLEPGPQLEITAMGDTATRIGGGKFVFRYSNADFAALAARPRAVVPVPDPNIQLLSSAVDQGDGTTLITVILLNPHGFNTGNDKTGLLAGRSQRRSLRFSLVWSSNNAIVTDTNWFDSLQLVTGQYFDIDGNDIAGLSATVTKTR